MGGRQEPNGNRRRARRNSHTQDGNEDDENQTPDGNNPYERLDSSVQGNGENEGHRLPDRSAGEVHDRSDGITGYGNDRDGDDVYGRLDEDTRRLRPPHTRLPSPMPGSSRNGEATEQPSTQQAPIQQPMTNNQTAINQPPFPGHPQSGGVPPQAISARLPEFTVSEYYNALPPQQRGSDQRLSQAGFTPNTNQSNRSAPPNATGSPAVSVNRPTPRRANNSQYLTSERGRLQNSSAEDRFLAAGIAPPLQTSSPVRRPGIASGRHDGEPRNQHLAIFAENVIAIQQRHPGATQNEIAHFIQEHLEFERRILGVAVQYRREQYHQRMWTRFCHEYLRRELGLADEFSDDVLDWLLAVICSSIGEQDGEHDESASE